MITRHTDPRGQPLWDDAAVAPLPALEGDVEAEVCVVGLGASGLVCVRELRRLGASVVGLDAGRVGGGAAGRNGGFLLAGLAPFYHDAVASFGRERSRRMYQLTLEELDRIEHETPEGIERGGSLRIAESDDERADCEAQLSAMRADGLPAEWYDGPEGVGLLIPGDGTFQPLLRCRALAAAAVSEGARLFERSPVTEIGDGVVRTHSGTVRAGTVIVAVDGALERLLPELSSRVRTARLQMLATAPTDEVSLPRPVYARWGYDYWQQRPDGSIALGGGRDLAGDSEWTADATPTAPVQALLERRLRDALGVQAPITHRWAASVGYTDDGLPVVGEVRQGVWALGGYSGTGNVIGTLLGRGVARAVVAESGAIVQAFASS